MTAAQILKHMKTTFFKSTKADIGMPVNSVSYTAALVDAAITSTHSVEQLFALGFAYRAVVGFGTYDRKDTQQVKDMIDGLFGTYK